MEEIEFFSSVLAWFLLCVVVGVLEAELIFTYEEKEIKALGSLLEKINEIARTSKNIEFEINLPKVGLEITKIEKLNESAVRIGNPLGKSITVLFEEGIKVILDGSNITFVKKP